MKVKETFPISSCERVVGCQVAIGLQLTQPAPCYTRPSIAKNARPIKLFNSDGSASFILSTPSSKRKYSTPGLLS
ncbi:hypothetical protein M3J09_009540 [Ascochyta lentis]